MELSRGLIAVREILYSLGEDPSREGLKDTPKRVVNSWLELYSGYDKDPGTLLTTFTDINGYDQIIICKDIEIYSMCEHHMLPFFGKAHVAYLPKNKVIGLSKLPRLVDMYARRLQIQERIGQQVTEALMKYLDPLGAACIIEAVHMCTRMRGVNKQESKMVTASVTGCFREDISVKSELMQLLGMTSL